MISEMFYQKEINNSNRTYVFNEDYIFYFVNKKLNIKGPSKRGDIKLWIAYETEVTNINNQKFEKFLKFFKYLGEKNCYFISDDIKIILKLVESFEFDFAKACEQSQEIIYKNLKKYISPNKINILHALPRMFALDKKTSLKENDYYSYLFFKNIYYYNKNYIDYDMCITNVDDKYKNLTLDLIFENKDILDVLFANGINTIRELSELSVDTLLMLFSYDPRSYFSILNELTVEFKSNYIKNISSIFDKLKDNEKDIISKRYGFNNTKCLSLEEVGKKYNVSRERIRQIETLVISKLVKNIKSLNIVFATIYYEIINLNEKYFTKEALLNYVKNQYATDIILFLISQDETIITYHSYLGIIYNKKITSKEEIIENTLDLLGDIIVKNKYINLNDFERKIVDLNYNLVDDNVYLKKGLQRRKLILNIIDDLFPDGYHISDKEELKQVEDEYYKRYGYKRNDFNERAIASYFDRDNYCLIDRGIYKNAEFLIALPPELKDEIIEYIINHQPTVYYTSIYEHFKCRLREIGINNNYYLKGLLDINLPKEFNTKRDYIQIGDKSISSIDTIKKYMKKFNGIFTYDDLSKNFEGVKYYVFNNVLYSEIANGLIWVTPKRYIYEDKLNISKSVIERFDIFIQSLFRATNTTFLSSRKIYSRLFLTDKELLKELKIVDNQFALFSLIKYYFADKYAFSRPLIYIDKNVYQNQEELIKDYVSKLDKFNHKTIKTLQSKIAIHDLYSYLEFMEDMSEDYVQYNVDSMVKKELLNVDNNFKKEFLETFNLIFTNFEHVNTKTFNGYMLLPQLEYKRNKYLLVGIIRTYFSDLFIVENTLNVYDQTDFIIRKIS